VCRGHPLAAPANGAYAAIGGSRLFSTNVQQAPSGPASSIETSKIKKLRPRSPGTRHQVRIDRSHLWKGKPMWHLTEAMRKTGGRNNSGKITVRHRGGGHKRRYRKIDFKRDIFDKPAIVERIEYDPNRTAEIALLRFPHLEGEDAYRYIIAPQALEPGAEIMTSMDELKMKTGNCMPLRHIPIGQDVCCVEMIPGKGAQLGRSAGSYLTMLDKQMKEDYALMRQQSGEKRFIPLDSLATVGAVSNPLHKIQKLGKAGRKRHLGRRPHVRGVAMNPVDHPMGGGEGRSAGGRPSCSPTGVIAKGFKTRKKSKPAPLVYESRKAAQLQMKAAKNKK